MRDMIEQQFHCKVVQWAEPTDDGAIFSAVKDGRWLMAESLALLISALQDADPRPLMLLAA